MANTPKVWGGTAWVELEAAPTLPSAASTAVAGIVQLTDSVSSTSTTTAATPNSVKTAYDASVLKSTFTATGDIVYASGSATVTRLAAGSANQVLTMGASVPAWAYRPAVVTNAQSGTAYTLVLGDAGKLIEFTGGTAATLTIPANSSVAFDVGTQIDVLQVGTATVTVGTANVTLQANGNKYKLNGQYAAATLIKRATDTWVLIGNLTT